MTKDVSPFVEEFNEAVKAAEVFLFIARDSVLQQETIDSLKQMLPRIASEKAKAVEAKNEGYANLLLGCECVTEALIAEINMWLLLKQEKPDAAWDQLIAAQMASVAAVRAHGGFSHLEHHNRRLEAIERLVFPPQVFVSSGMIVRRQECSICGMEYEDCDHLIGRPYLGKSCYIIAGDLELDHVSIVDQPADKRCRVQHFSVEGGDRNRMTWRVEKQKRDTQQIADT